MKRNKNLSVSFKRKVVVHPALHRNDYTKEERKSVWYTQKDMDSIKAERKETLKMMKKSHGDYRSAVDMKEILHCSRGLEARTKATSQEKRTIRRRSITAVIQEQLSQQELFGDKLYYPELIAMSYEPHTLKAEKYAFICALLDQQDAFEYCVEDEEVEAEREDYSSNTADAIVKFGKKTKRCTKRGISRRNSTGNCVSCRHDNMNTFSVHNYIRSSSSRRLI